MARVVQRLHAIAEEMIRFSGRTPISGDKDESLIHAYGMTSVDVLEYLLIVEEEFGIDFADEELNADMVSSVRHLADHVIAAQQPRTGGRAE